MNRNTLRKGSTDVILRQAIEDNDVAQVKFVLRFEKVKINDQDENQMTALHWACVYGRLEIVALLLDNGADIEMKDSKGWTALHFAANSGYLDVVELLLASCADVEATSNDGKVAIDVAQGEGMVFLLATGCIKAGKQDLLLRYFSDSTSSLRSIDENGDEINTGCLSQQNLTAVEIWRASQQFLTKEFSHLSKTDSMLKVSTSDYGICKNENNVPKVEKRGEEVIQRKRSVPLVQQDQQTSSTAQFLTLPRKSKLNNFDSSFSPGVLRRFAVSETNLNSPQAMDCNNNVHGTNENSFTGENNMQAKQWTRGQPNFEFGCMDSELFIAAEESRI